MKKLHPSRMTQGIHSQQRHIPTKFSGIHEIEPLEEVGCGLPCRLEGTEIIFNLLLVPHKSEELKQGICTTNGNVTLLRKEELTMQLQLQPKYAQQWRYNNWYLMNIVMTSPQHGYDITSWFPHLKSIAMAHDKLGWDNFLEGNIFQELF